METWRVNVEPGISEPELRSIWRHAIKEAEEHPGKIVIIAFAPGNYPNPDPGVYVYKNVPTPMHVRRPIEIEFTYSETSGVTMETYPKAS